MVAFKTTGKRADADWVAKMSKAERVLGPATVVKPALYGAAALLLVQGAMKMLLHA